MTEKEGGFYKRLIERAREAVIISCADGSLTYANEAAARMFGCCNASELLKKSAFELHANPGQRELLLKELNEKGFFEDRDVNYIKQDGSGDVFTALVCCTAFRNEQGELIHYESFLTDITVIKSCENALNVSRNYLDAIFLNSPIGLAIGTPDGRFVILNPAAEKILGYSLAELQTLSVKDITHPEDFEKDLALYLEVIEGRRHSYCIEKRYIRKDGKTIRALFGVTMIRDESGINQFAVATIEDITEAKAAEAILADSENRFRALFEEAPLGYQSLDSEGRILTVNKAWLDLLGYHKQEVIGKWFGNFLAPYEIPDFRQRFSAFIKRGKVAVETDMVHRDGSTLVVHVDGRTATDSSGNFKQTHCILHNITERKRMQDELKQSEERFRRLSEASFEALVIHKNGIIRQGNGRFFRMLGYRPEELIGKDILTTLIPEASRRQLSSFMYVPGNGPFEAFFMNKCGCGIPVEVRVQEMVIHDEKVNVMAILDVSKRRQFETDLLKSRDEVVKLAMHVESIREKERAKIAADLHDDLGQRLTAIHLELAGLKKRMERHSPQLKDKINTISSMVVTSIETIQALTAELRPGILDDLGLIAAIEWQLNELEKRTGISFSFTHSSDELKIPKELGVHLFRVVQEALTNIIRHSDAARASVELRSNNGILSMKIEDDGRGITKDRISDSFSLGIIGMRERVRSCGGTFSISGSEMSGTIIKISIPINQGV